MFLPAYHAPCRDEMNNTRNGENGWSPTAFLSLQAGKSGGGASLTLRLDEKEL